MERVVYYLYRGLLWLLQRLSIENAWRLGYALGTLGRFVAPGYTALARRNLWLAFGDDYTPAERRRLANRSLQITLANLFTGPRASTLSEEQLRERILIKNTEELDPLFADSHGLIIAIAHLSAWELFSLGKLVSGPKRGVFLYQRIRNKLIDQHFRDVRARHGLTPLDRQTEIREAPRNLRKGGALGILVDQHAGDQGQWLPFFDRLASTSPIPGNFARKTGSNVIFAALQTVGPARWTIRVTPIARTADNVPEDVINLRVQQALETAIREKPEDWFWVHNRWKTPHPNFLLQNYRRGVVSPELMQAEPKKFKMLVRSPNWLGDAVMAIPAVRAFKAGRPDASVTVLCHEKLATVWEQDPAVDAVLTYPGGAKIGAVAKIIREAGPFQAGILLPNSLRTGLEMWRGGVWRRVGYPGHQRRWLLDHVVPEPDGATAPPMHHALRYLNLARACGAVLPENLAPANLFPGRDPAVVAASGSIKIGICPGAEYGPAKRWFPENFAETIRLIHAERPEIEWLIFGVKGDKPQAEAILENLAGKNEGDIPCPAKVTDRVGETSLGELISDLRSCTALLTNDTGTMHLSGFLGTPTVAIFGSTEPELTEPLGPGHKILRQHVPCSPCFLRECVFNMECMKNVTPAMAASALRELLRETHQP